MATEDLSIDNILDQGDIDNLFMDNETQETQESQPENKGNEDNKETPEQEQTTEVNTDDLFVEPESVGSEENKEKEGTETEKESTSPNNNFYSSIAKTFAVESIFPDLTDDEIKNANSAEALVELINKQIDSRLDEKQQRVINALDAGIEPDDIRRYENTISYLDSIDEDKLNAETPEGEELRKRLEHRKDKPSIKEIELRLNRFDYEESKIGMYDYVLKNNDLEKSVQIIMTIIENEKKLELKG